MSRTRTIETGVQTTVLSDRVAAATDAAKRKLAAVPDHLSNNPPDEMTVRVEYVAAPSDRQLRVECLKMAVETRTAGATAGQLIERAEELYAWACGPGD